MQSPGLPQVDLEEMIGREMQCKVLEAIEENDRLVLSNRKSAFSQKKLTYNVSLCTLFQFCRTRQEQPHSSIQASRIQLAAQLAQACARRTEGAGKGWMLKCDGLSVTYRE